jgi:hypothetical protein
MLGGDLRLRRARQALDFVIRERKTDCFGFSLPVQWAKLIFAASGLMIVEQQPLS